MNYFEIINAVLIELNYPQVATFADLTKLEHKRLMNIINRLNKEICNLSENFYFRQFSKKIKLYTNKIEYNPNINGTINKIIGKTCEYIFEPDYEKFYANKEPKYSYGLYGAKVLIPPSDDEVKIFYSTDNFVLDNSENLKTDFEVGTDKSIIPDNFVEKLFINGASYEFKQNSSHPKYAHWKQEYNNAKAELLSASKQKSGSKLIIDGGFRKL